MHTEARLVVSRIQCSDCGRKVNVQEQTWCRMRLGVSIVSRLDSCVDLRKLIDCVALSIEEHKKIVRAARERIWKDRFIDSWAAGGADVYKWCKGEQKRKGEYDFEARRILDWQP